MKTEKIHKLINSMSGAEKRHFYRTIRGGKESKYAQLFSAIANQKAYNESSLIKKFGYGDNHNNFAAAKKQLFKLTLKSLREFSSHFGDYQRILQHLKDIEILESRGLRTETFKSIKKARTIAKSNAWPIFNLLTEHWEQRLSAIGDLTEIITPMLGHHIDVGLQYEILYKRVRHHNILYSSFSLHLNPNHCYPEIVGHELMQHYNSELTGHCKWFFCLIKIECCRTLMNTEEASKWAKELIRIQQSMPTNGYYNSAWRREGIFAYLHSLLDNYEIDLFLKEFHLIKDLEYESHWKELTLEKVRDSLVLETYLFVISDKGEKTFEELITQVKEYIPNIGEDYLDYNDVMLILGVQYIFYSKRQDDESVKWAAMLEKYVDKKEHIKYYIVSKVMSLLSHYALGNYMYIKNILPNLERFIKKNNRLNSEYVFLFRVLNKLQDTPTKRDREGLLKNFKADMKALQKTNRKNHLLSAHSLMVWADNCLSQEEFLETNRQLFASELP